MQVILIENIRKLGKLGDLVNVRPGFARNYLVLQGKAYLATKENLAIFEERRAELEKKANALLDSAKEQADAISGSSLEISAQASAEGKLYGSVGSNEIIEAIAAKTNIQLSKQNISLPDGVIRAVGEYKVNVLLHGDYSIDIDVNVIAIQENKHSDSVDE